MAWIMSHQSLARHPKTRKLARLLGISLPDAIGRLHLLWWWALDYADDGDLSGFDDSDIADAMLWEGDPTALTAALVASGFMDEDRKIHDWWDYAGQLVERRRADAERHRRQRATYRKSYGLPETVPQTSSGRPEDIHGTSECTQHNTTQHNSTEPTLLSQIEPETPDKPPESAPSGAKSLGPKKNNHSPPKPYSEAEQCYMQIWGRKRLNAIQRQKIAEVVEEAGLPAWQKAIEWAATGNISNLQSIITRARNIKKGGNTGGSYSGYPRQSAGAHPGGNGRFTGSTSEEALQWARDHGGNLPFGWRYIERNGVSVPVRD